MLDACGAFTCFCPNHLVGRVRLLDCFVSRNPWKRIWTTTNGSYRGHRFCARQGIRCAGHAPLVLSRGVELTSSVRAATTLDLDLAHGRGRGRTVSMQPLCGDRSILANNRSVIAYKAIRRFSTDACSMWRFALHGITSNRHVPSHTTSAWPTFVTL